MTHNRHVEAHVFDADATIVDTFRDRMPGVAVGLAPNGRSSDIAQIIEIIGDVASIVAGLIALKSIIPQRPQPIVIVIRDEAGETLELNEATDEDIRKAFEQPPG